MAKWLFCWLFSSSSFFFLVFTMVQSVMCPMWSLFEVQHYSGINSQPWKKAAREINLSLQEMICMKNPSRSICEVKTGIFVQCLGQIKKSKLFYFYFMFLMQRSLCWFTFVKFLFANLQFGQTSLHLGWGVGQSS